MSSIKPGEVKWRCKLSSQRYFHSELDQILHLVIIRKIGQSYFWYPFTNPLQIVIVVPHQRIEIVISIAVSKASDLQRISATPSLKGRAPLLSNNVPADGEVGFPSAQSLHMTPGDLHLVTVLLDAPTTSVLSARRKPIALSHMDSLFSSLFRRSHAWRAGTETIILQCPRQTSAPNWAMLSTLRSISSASSFSLDQENSAEYFFLITGSVDSSRICLSLSYTPLEMIKLKSILPSVEDGRRQSDSTV